MAINRSISNINVDDSADNGKVPVFNSTTKVFDMTTPSGSSSMDGARVYKSSGQASIASTLTVLTFDSESYDTNSYHDNSTNNSRLTVPTTGYYRMVGTVSTSSNSVFRAAIRINGSTTIMDISSGNAGASVNNGQMIVTDYALTAGDYVELLGAFMSGTYTTTSGIAGTTFSIQFLGA